MDEKKHIFISQLMMLILHVAGLAILAFRVNAYAALGVFLIMFAHGGRYHANIKRPTDS